MGRRHGPDRRGQRLGLGRGHDATRVGTRPWWATSAADARRARGTAVTVVTAGRPRQRRLPRRSPPSAPAAGPTAGPRRCRHRAARPPDRPRTASQCTARQVPRPRRRRSRLVTITATHRSKATVPRAIQNRSYGRGERDDDRLQPDDDVAVEHRGEHVHDEEDHGDQRQRPVQAGHCEPRQPREPALPVDQHAEQATAVNSTRVTTPVARLSVPQRVGRVDAVHRRRREAPGVAAPLSTGCPPCPRSRGIRPRSALPPRLAAGAVASAGHPPTVRTWPSVAHESRRQSGPSQPVGGRGGRG